MKKVILTLSLLIVPMVVLAQSMTSSTSTVVDPNLLDLTGVGALVGLMIKAFHSKAWEGLAGLILTAVVFVLRYTKLLDKIKLGGKWGTRVTTVGLSLLATLALGLQTWQSWENMLSTWLSVTAFALLGWELPGKAVRDGLTYVKGMF